MKNLKAICAVFMSMIFVFSGCTPSGDNKPLRTERIDSLGLEYDVPEEWETIADTNVFRFIVAPEGAFAIVRYSYATTEDLERMSENFTDTSTPLDDYLTPVCSILIYNREDEDSESVESIKEKYDSEKLLAKQGSYVYCGLWDYEDTSKTESSPLDKEGYRKLANSAPKLMDSVRTFDFDPEEIMSRLESESATLTFISETLDGERISSEIFASYDLTMVYFWASYCYPDINELPVLQEVYESLQRELPNVNLILAAIDTPDEEAEAVIKKAAAEAGCTFTVFKMDEALGSWVLNNLEGLPTTIFVDKEGNIVGEKISGLQSRDVYRDSIKALLEQ